MQINIGYYLLGGNCGRRYLSKARTSHQPIGTPLIPLDRGALPTAGAFHGAGTVIYALKDGASLTQKELARLVRIEQPTMAQLLSRMERDGLVRRTDNPDDKRSSLISLTPLALRKLPLARAILSEGNKEALKGFTDREIATLSRLLLRVVRNFDPEIAAEIESMHAR